MSIPQVPPQQPMQAVQLSSAQVEKAIKNFEARVKAKTLECASLDQLRTASADLIARIYSYRQPEDQKGPRDAIYNYLTAKLNEELINLEELELRLKATKAMTNMVQPAIVS